MNPLILTQVKFRLEAAPDRRRHEGAALQEEDGRNLSQNFVTSFLVAQSLRLSLSVMLLRCTSISSLTDRRDHERRSSDYNNNNNNKRFTKKPIPFEFRVYKNLEKRESKILRSTTNHNSHNHILNCMNFISKYKFIQTILNLIT